jgi:hypothetical protein
MSLTLNPNPQSQPNDGAPVEGTPGLPAVSDNAVGTSIDKAQLLERVQGWWKIDRDHWAEWRQEAATCFDFVAGRQWSDEDLQILADQMRPAITFNRIDPFVDTVGGMEINNRQEIMYAPRTVGSTGVSDVLTAAGQWSRGECDAEDEETEAFLDAVTCGVGWTQTRMDYDVDPDGMPVTERIDPLEIWPDSNARKQNLTDGNHLTRVKDMAIQSARDLFPGVPDSMLHAQWAEDEADNARQPHNARIAPYYRIDQSGVQDHDQSLVRLVEVEWWQYEPAFRVFDPATGRFVLLGAEDAARYRIRSQFLGIKPTLIKDRRRVYYKAIIGAEVLKIMEGPSKGGFTYKAITGKRDRMKGIWYGLVRAMRDPQMWANKWLSQGLHIVNTNAKGGLLAEADAFDDPDEARDSWADADSITLLNPGGLSKVQQKQPPAFPAQINLMSEMAINAIPMVSGINMEMMGQSTSQAPQVGVVEVGRKQAGMNVLARLFNAKRRYQKEQGRLLLWMIQEYIADGRLIRIGGPENVQYVPLVHEPGVAEYDVIVDETPTSPSMKDKVWQMLMQLFPMLRGIQIPPKFYMDALKYSPFPASFVSDAQKILSEPPPPNPLMQGQDALNQAKAADLQARSQKTQIETAHQMRMSDLEANEKEAVIEKTRADAVNALQNAGIGMDDMRFKQTMDAINAVLSLHGARLQHNDQVHRHEMERRQPVEPTQDVASAPQ